MLQVEVTTEGFEQHHHKVDTDTRKEGRYWSGKCIIVPPSPKFDRKAALAFEEALQIFNQARM
jgi:hypothetical protein